MPCPYGRNAGGRRDLWRAGIGACGDWRALKYGLAANTVKTENAQRTRLRSTGDSGDFGDGPLAGSGIAER